MKSEFIQEIVERTMSVWSFPELISIWGALIVQIELDLQ